MTKHLGETRDRWVKEFKKRLGSTFDSFLKSEGTKEEVDALAREKVALADGQSPQEKRLAHEALLRELELPIDLAGRSGFSIGDPRLEEMKLATANGKYQGEAREAQILVAGGDD